MGNISFQKLTAQEWHVYKEIRLDALTHDPLAFGDTYTDASNWDNSMWQQKLDPEKITILLASVDNAPAGIIGFSPSDDSRSKHTVTLRNVYLKPTYRGLGLGKKMIEEIENEIKKDPYIKKISLHVTVTQKNAVGLYESMGYRKIGILEKEIKVDGNYYDEYAFEKLL